MATGYLKTKKGKNIQLYRSYTANADLSSTEYLAPTKVRIGVDAVTPNVDNTDLAKPIPISNGTVCDDGSNTFTGSNGATDSTDNISVYKDGAGVSDVTAQNLLTDGIGSSATKTWTIADLASAGTNADATKYVGLWLYIKDSTTLLKFKTSGTCLEFRLGADTTTNYYSKTYEAADLSTGWNWLSNNSLLSSWTSNGTPGTLNDFAIIITTNNAADEFVAGDVVYDLLRQWTYAESLKAFSADYPSFDYDNNEVLIKSRLTVLDANGFLIDNASLWNEDTSPIMASEDSMGNESKSSTDEFILVFKERFL